MDIPDIPEIAFTRREVLEGAASWGLKYVASRLFLSQLGSALAGEEERGSVARKGPNYAIVVRDSTYRSRWGRAVDALRNKYPTAHIVKFSDNIERTGDELREQQPTHVAYVATPDELAIPEMPTSEELQRAVAERSSAGRFNRLLSNLDDDGYRDAIGGIITGFAPEDAVGLAEAQPFEIDYALFKTQDEYSNDSISEFPRAVSFSGGICLPSDGVYVKKRTKNGEGVIESRVSLAGPDLLAALKSGELDLLATIGDADPVRWRTSFNYKDYVFEADGRGNIVVRDQEERIIGGLSSPNPKVYWGVGHHQLARIKSRTESLPLSWIHSGGVKQLFGYLTDMRYGFASIGLQNHLFASDRPTFFEARHMNDLAMKYLVEKLDQYCRSRGIEVDSREGGRRYDEHIFLGFGDPALDVRIRRDPNSVPLLGKGMEVDRVGNRKGYRFSVTVNKDCTLNTGASAEKPVISPPVFLLPEKIKSLQNVRATEGLKYHIGDDFVVFDIGSNIVVENGSAKLVPTQLAAGQTWELSFTS